MRAHLVGAGLQQLVAAVHIELAAANRLTEQDLEVDLVVGAVNPGGVVDEVGVDGAARLRELDAGPVREAKVAALTHHAAAQLVGVHADALAGAILRLGI